MKKLFIPVLLLVTILSLTACGGKTLNENKLGNKQDVGTHQEYNEKQPNDNSTVGGIKTNSLEFKGVKVTINYPTKYGTDFIKNSSGSNGSVWNDKYRISMFVAETSVSEYFNKNVDSSYKYMQKNPQKYSQIKTSEQKTITGDNGIEIVYKKFNYINKGVLGTYTKEDVYAISDIGNGFAYLVQISGTSSTISESMIKEFMNFTVSK